MVVVGGDGDVVSSDPVSPCRILILNGHEIEFRIIAKEIKRKSRPELCVLVR